MIGRPVALLSVDLDEVDCYAAIHGLPIPSFEGGAAGPVYRHALPRLQQLFADEGVAATFFAIGRDARRAEPAAKLAELCQAGHEVSNHSSNHLYDLSRRDAERMLQEVREGADAIEAATGVRPVGFRAPGYTTNDALMKVLQDEGLRYDSSVFPCPGYHAARSAAIALIRLRGRRSRSLIDDPRVLSAPADPYRIGRPYWRRGDGLIEFPIGVTSGFTGRLPFIGTSVVLAGRRGALPLTQMMAGREVVSLELHGIDVADAERDGLEWLRPHQPDLRADADSKLEILRVVIAELKAQGREFITIDTAAERFSC